MQETSEEIKLLNLKYNWKILIQKTQISILGILLAEF